MNIPLELSLGIHTNHSPIHFDEKEGGKYMRYAISASNIAGWIPVVGTIVGLARLFFTAGFMVCLSLWEGTASVITKDDERFKDVKGKILKIALPLLIRGALETLSLGAVYMLPDIGVTVGREIYHKTYDKPLVLKKPDLT